MSFDPLDLLTVRQEITELLSTAAVDERVLNALRFQDGLTPKETELWDYKREAPSTTVALAKTVLQIVSFYNSYGGYIIYGASEKVRDQCFSISGVTPNAIKVHQLKDLIREYTGEIIDITYRELPVSDPRTCLLGVLLVPKRPLTVPPLAFGKNGPDKEPGKPVFRKEQVYFRELDRSEAATTIQHYMLLFGARQNPNLWDATAPESLRTDGIHLADHTLPDKNLICPHFIGRLDILQALWKWLGDDFVHVKVLVGDGGKGKTSIAYEFARQVCFARAFGADKVIWLTAKSKRFVGARNEYVPMPDTHFTDTRTLLESIAREVAILDDEIRDSGTPLLKKRLKDSLSQLRCVIVVDDVDSADIEEQKTILHTAHQLAHASARFLITTRMNFALSDEVALVVRGLIGDEYVSFVSKLATEFNIPALRSKEIERLRQTTDGSPLFTESLFRLLKTGLPLDAAIKQWKGKLGTEVRNAALKKEIALLSPESRRLLLACALMTEASLTELKQVTRYIDDRIHSCIEELQALFLLNAPTLIKGEPRFTTSSSTRLLVIENAKLLVADHAAIEKSIQRLRVAPQRIRRDQHVGRAITQAIALSREHRHDDALETVTVALREAPDNADLRACLATCLFFRARFEADRNSLDDARKEFRKSHQLGQRKSSVFEYWYDAEALAEDWMSAVEVATLAEGEAADRPDFWQRRKAAAHLELARAHSSRVSIETALAEYYLAADEIGAVLKAMVGNRNALFELLWQIHDEAWRLHRANFGEVPDLRFAFENIKLAIHRGDMRLINALRLAEICELIAEEFLSSPLMSGSQRNLLSQLTREGTTLSRRMRPSGAAAKGWEALMERWEALGARLDAVV